jgi:hypothetical protein
VDAVVGDDGGEGDSAEECQGVLVVAGGHASPVFEAVETSLDGVALPVGGRVEAVWATAV